MFDQYGNNEKSRNLIDKVFDKLKIRYNVPASQKAQENNTQYQQAEINNKEESNNQLLRKDGKSIDIEYYNNDDIEIINSLNIRKLNFANKNFPKDIKKADINKTVFKELNKVNIKNSKSNITATLSKSSLKKIISTVFDSKKENSVTRLEKEIISNIETIFENAVPILKHKELKNEHLYDKQIIHRFALPIQIGNNNFLTMITVKERVDFNEAKIDEFQIYDLRSKKNT